MGPLGRRNIPACAGKTPPVRICTAVAGEHPRVRGENFSGSGVPNLRLGTSPRARGKPQCILNLFIRHRNIPACAGKTRCGANEAVVEVEHPRVRGENLMKAGDEIYGTGTSPRARGKLAEAVTTMEGWRNIPACAGKTRSAPSAKCSQ